MLIAITHIVSSHIADCELTHIDRQPIDMARAQAQHRAYCKALERCGARVIVSSANDGRPDGCFVEDTAIVLDEAAVITNPGADSRREETEAIAAELRTYRELFFLPPKATIDGGDVLRIGKRLFIGLSSRTNRAAIEAIKGLVTPLGYEVHSIEVSGSLHLKTACTALNEETLLLNPQWVSREAFPAYRLIEVAPDEPWAANIVRIGNAVLAQSDFPRTLEQIAPYCGEIIPLDISEFRKAEAGLSCLSLLFTE